MESAAVAFVAKPASINFEHQARMDTYVHPGRETLGRTIVPSTKHPETGSALRDLAILVRKS